MRSSMQPRDITEAVEALSRPRLSSYKRFFAANAEAEQYGLHQWNEAISMLFFKLLSLTEIAVRNQFHRALSAQYGNPGFPAHSRDWYGYLQLAPKSVESVRKITHTRRHGNWFPRNPTPSPDDVMSKLTFGFWTHILDVSVDSSGQSVDWPSMMPLILPGHRQRDVTYWQVQAHRDQIFARLDLCNGLRNRVAHHEPLWKAGPLLEERRPRSGRQVQIITPAPSNQAEALARLQLLYERMQELLGWLSPALLRVHKSSETHFHLATLISPLGINHFRKMTTTEQMNLQTYRKLKTLKKRFVLLHRRGMPVHIKKGGSSLGYWVTIPS